MPTKLTKELADADKAITVELAGQAVHLRPGDMLWVYNNNGSLLVEVERAEEGKCQPNSLGQ